MRVPVLLLMSAGLGSPALADTVANRDFPVAGFNRVVVEGPYDVDIRSGSRPAASARGPQEQLDRLILVVKGDVLVVKTRKSSWGWSTGRNATRVAITAPALRSVQLSGSGNIVLDQAKGTSFSAGVSGSGDMRIDRIEADTLSLRVTGSGDLAARGTAQNVTASVTGSGNIAAGSLAAADLVATVTGSGDIDMGATRSAKATVTGSGDIRIAGRPNCTQRKTGSGSIRCGG
ncbi:head GIN domain-containing protein [Rhizorhabdus sp. FW153]|uniref:head GIN domain-containing protein n=1 Tax=Rhizorhabdus sp. FW153 TaxID=3400216 RepID=UPI003CFAC199